MVQCGIHPSEGLLGAKTGHDRGRIDRILVEEVKRTVMKWTGSPNMKGLKNLNAHPYMTSNSKASVLVTHEVMNPAAPVIY